MATYDEEERKRQAQETSQRTESQLRAGDAAQAAQEESSELEGMQPRQETPTPSAGSVNAGQTTAVVEEGSERGTSRPSWRDDPQNSWQSYAADWRKNNPLESDEDYEKRRRRTRASAIISALGEGLSSLGNLYYTTHYSPSAAPTNLSAGMQKRYADMEADRAKNKEAWAKGYQQARQLDETRDQWEKNWRRIQERDAKQDEINAKEQARKDAEEARKQALHEPQMKIAQAQAKSAEAQAKYADEIEALKRDAAAAGVRLNNAQIKKILEKPTYGGNGSGSGSSSGSGGGKPYGTFLDRTYYNAADYNAAVKQATIALGLPEVATKTKDTGKGEVVKEQVFKNIDARAAAVVNHLNKNPRDVQKILYLTGYAQGPQPWVSGVMPQGSSVNPSDYTFNESQLLQQLQNDDNSNPLQTSRGRGY